MAHAQQPADPSAGPTIIAALPFDGREATNPPKKPLNPLITASAINDALMSRPQSARYRMLPPDLFGSIARLKYRGRAPDLRAMSRLLKASLMLGGYLEATPGPDAPRPFRLTLTLYNADGQLLGQLAYDLSSSVIDGPKFLEQATAFLQMLDGALRIPSLTAVPLTPVAATPQQPQPSYPGAQPTPQNYYPPPAPTPYQPPVAVQPRPQPAGSGRPVYQADDQEAAPLGDQPLIPKTKEASEIYDKRPPWQPALDVRIGYLYNSRVLSNDGSNLSFPRSGASGVFFNFELHPLAFLRDKSGALAGLGMRLSAMGPAWGSISQVEGGSGTVGSYKAYERRIEFALRWHYNPWDELYRPDFEIEGLFGDHDFEFSQPMNVLYLHLPSADYRYLGALFGARMFFTRWLSARAALSLAKDLSMGLMTTPGLDAMGNSLLNNNGFQSYGPGSGWLWRADLGVTAEIWNGILAGFAFYYEANKLSFEGQGNIQQTNGMPVTSAKDEYLGVMLTVGYYFRGRKN